MIGPFFSPFRNLRRVQAEFRIETYGDDCQRISMAHDLI